MKRPFVRLFFFEADRTPHEMIFQIEIALFPDNGHHIPSTTAGLMPKVVAICLACFKVGSLLPERISLIFDWFIPNFAANPFCAGPQRVNGLSDTASL